jgi:hypothetical protein
MTRATTTDGLEAYPYDPSLKMDALSGLERLRCIADRELAAHLFILFEQAQRNTQVAGAASAPYEFDTERLRLLAARALRGELGSKPKELAECMLFGRGRDARRSFSSGIFDGVARAQEAVTVMNWVLEAIACVARVCTLPTRIGRERRPSMKKTASRRPAKAKNKIVVVPLRQLTAPTRPGEFDARTTSPDARRGVPDRASAKGAAPTQAP